MLAFDRYGQGATTVALLHGVGGGRAIWSDGASGTARRLAEAGFEVVALDLPGYGDSPLPSTLTIAGMAEAARDTLQALGVRAAVWLGHSMGGMVAQELAAIDPTAVHGLMLACTSPAFGKADGNWQQGFLRDRLAPLEAGMGMEDLARQLMPGMLAPDAEPMAAERGVAVMARVHVATYRAALQALMGFDRRTDLSRIAVPTLVLAAAADRTAPPEVMQRMAQRIPGAEYACVPDAGHLPNVERPLAFHAPVADFLQRHFSAKG